MNIQVLKDYEEMSKTTAQFIIDYVNQRPEAVLCLAGGHTPKRTYELLVEAHQNGHADFSKATFVGLDEFVGLGKEDSGSCLHFLYESLFHPLGTNEENILFFDATSDDLASECKRIDRLVFEKGGIDIVLLGVGMNGHLGFNEPGVSFEQYSHVIELSDTSKTVGQKYFDQETKLERGITLGVKHILEAKHAILIANGEKKASIIEKTVKREVTNEIPSTALHLHRNAYVFIDEKAASNLQEG